jgi:hypothetical protein
MVLLIKHDIDEEWYMRKTTKHFYEIIRYALKFLNIVSAHLNLNR